MKENRKKVLQKGLVFGVFDGLHDGHKAFLSEASSLCRELIVVLTLPEVVQELKKRAPKYSYEDRTSALMSFNPSLVVVPSDVEIGSWKVLDDYVPDVVFLGYDQQAIAVELEKRGVVFVFLKPHKPHIYRSSLLNS